MVTGAQWNQLPERYGKWNSVYRFHLRWAKKGVFERMLQLTVKAKDRTGIRIIDATHIKVHQDACHSVHDPIKQGFGKTKGGRNSKLNALTNHQGKLIRCKLVPGNESDMKSANEVIGDAKDKVILADRGFDSDSIRDHIVDAGGVANIPGKKNRMNPVFYIKEVGKMRYAVENYFCRIKRYRRIGTRYDRNPETFLSFVYLSSLMDWLR